MKQRFLLAKEWVAQMGEYLREVTSQPFDFSQKTGFFTVRKKIRIFCLFFLQNGSFSARISLLCHIGKFEGGATDG